MGTTAAASGVSLVPAVAAPGDQNTGVVVSDIVLSGLDGSPLTEQLTIDDEFLVKGKWDATNADPVVPGETFIIGLPDVFKFTEGVPPIDLVGIDPESGDQVTWAECAADNVTGGLTCTFTNAVLDREEIQGTFTFQAEAAKTTTEESVQFDLNGTPGVVELPGGGGIDDGIELPDSVSKSGDMNGNNWSITWTVDIPGASLLAAGKDIAKISDTLGAGHVLCDPIGLTVHTVRGDTVVDVSSMAAITSGAPGDSSFAFDLNAPDAGFDAGVTYRVKYQTCTPDGAIDPAGTEYSNSAQIEGWGEAGTGIGTVTNRPWHSGITKSGSMLGEKERDGKIAWTITVPGSELVTKDRFTLTENLGDGHQVGADTITGIKVAEQYGPSGDRWSDITNKLVPSGVTESDDAFAVTFTIAEGSGLTFKDSDWRYTISYFTDVTATDLPEGGTKYTNSAAIDGKVTTGSATVPGRKFDKAGKLNTDAKTLDGVEHTAFTALDWTVTVPGEKIHGLTNLELTDTLSKSHQVCEAGDPAGTVAERLGLKVQVLDQIWNGGKTPTPASLGDVSVAIAEPAAGSEDGQTLTLTIRQPEDAKFSRDYQYVFSYTTCTSSGGVDDRGTEYKNQILGVADGLSGKVTMNYSGSGTGTGFAKKGSVSVAKKIEGPGVGLVPDGTMFDVNVEEFSPSDKANAAYAYTLKVPLNGDAVSGQIQRGNGWTIRLSEPNLPAIPGVSFGAPKFAPGDGITLSDNDTVATAVITPKSNISLRLTNTAELGQMTVLKKLEGAAADQVDPEKLYSFTAAIDVSGLKGVPVQADRTFTLKNGATETLKNLPIGAVVTVTEAKPADDDTFTWADPVVSPNPVTISADTVSTPAAVTVTNSVSRTVGTFALSKSITGDQSANPAVPGTVTVTATWQQEGDADPSSKELILPTDGTAVALDEQLLIGTKVTLTETPLEDGSSVAWAAPGWSGIGVAQGDDNTAEVTIGRTADVLVSLTNHAATSTAGLNLLKVLSGEAVSDAPADTEFPVTATWVDGADEPQSVDLLINANEPTPLGVELPAGTVVTLTEGTPPAIDTVVWGSVTISGNQVEDQGDGTATVVVSDQQETVTLVSVTNEANWAPGTFSLKKQVEGILLDDAEVPETVEVIASWIEHDGDALVERSKPITVPTDGSKVDFGENLVAFTEVTLSETALEASDRFVWATPAWVGDDALVVHEDGTATLTVQPAGAHEISLTNTAKATEGSLQVAKTLSGTGKVSKDTAFAVTAKWQDLLGEQQSRDLTVSPNKPADLTGVPFGTEVTLTEVKGEDPTDARWASATWTSTDERVKLTADGRTATFVVTGNSELPIAFALDNEYKDSGVGGNVKGSSDAKGNGNNNGGGLVTTGGDIAGLIAAAGVLLALGAGALALSRRRKA